MRVLVCPTAFKESMDVGVATDAMIAGVHRVLPHSSVEAVPVSDGGPGLIEALRRSLGGRLEERRTWGPLGDPVRARVLWLSAGEVVIEAAEACGLHLIPGSRRDPLRTHTRGVGALLAGCVMDGARLVRLGLGGSATVDGGTGMAREFGYRFLDARGRLLDPGGGSLASLARIAGGRRPGARITAVADVRSPLLGEDGAAARFAPQKGASGADVAHLAAGLERLAACIERDLGSRVADLPGGGAAGGLGAGCVAFLGAQLRPGSSWLLRKVAFDTALAGADLVVTGEGEYDGTSVLGKIVWEVIDRAARAGVPVVLACGRVHGPVPTGVTAVDGGGTWLGPADLECLVAGALTDHDDRPRAGRSVPP